MNATEDQKTCKQAVASRYAGRISAIRRLWKLYQQDPEASCDDGRFDEYGLSWDYSPAEGRRRDYFRWQLSWGGPADEFRFFVGAKCNLVYIEYWFLDWGDGAKRTIKAGKDFDLLSEIWADMQECGMPDFWIKKSEE